MISKGNIVKYQWSITVGDRCKMCFQFEPAWNNSEGQGIILSKYLVFNFTANYLFTGLLMVPATINEIQNMAKRWHLYKEFYQMLMLIRFLLQEGQEIEVLCHLQGCCHLWKSDVDYGNTHCQGMNYYVKFLGA